MITIVSSYKQVQLYLRFETFTAQKIHISKYNQLR
jgi:hypothetical protein